MQCFGASEWNQVMGMGFLQSVVLSTLLVVSVVVVAVVVGDASSIHPIPNCVCNRQIARRTVGTHLLVYARN